MRTIGAAALGLVLFLAGLAAGWALRGGPPEAATPPPASPGEESAPARPDATPPEAAPGAPAAADTGPLRRWLATLPEPELAEGTGTVAALVRGEKGEPLPGVEVVLEPRYPARLLAGEAPAPGEAEDAAARVEREARRALWEAKACRTAATDAAGEVRFEGLPDTSFLVAPRLRGWKFMRAGEDTGPVRPGARLEFLAFAAVPVPVEVRLADGSEPESAVLRFPQGGRQSYAPWTPKARTVDLPAGDYEVRADSGNWALLKADPVAVHLAAGEEPAPLRFSLAGRPALTGRVRFPEGQVPARGNCRLLRVPPSGEVTDQQLLSLGTHWMIDERSGWEFVFRDLAPGRYRVGVTAVPYETILHAEDVEVGEGITVRDLAVPAPDPSRALAVRVLDPGGNALRDARIEGAYLEGGRPVLGANPPAAPRADGAYVLVFDRNFDQSAGAPRARLDPAKGVVRLSAYSDRFGGVAAEVRPGGAAPAEVRFAEPASLEVALDGYVGGPWHGTFRATLRSAASQGYGGVYLQAPLDSLDARGRAVFAAVQPGEYRLVLYLGRTGRGWDILREPLSVGAGRNEARASVPALHRVRFTGTRNWVGLRRSDDPAWTLNSDRPDAEGVVVMEGLPAGEYRIWTSGGGNRTFSVPGTAEVRLGE